MMEHFFLTFLEAEKSKGDWELMNAFSCVIPWPKTQIGDDVIRVPVLSMFPQDKGNSLPSDFSIASVSVTRITNLVQVDASSLSTTYQTQRQVTR